MYKKLIQSVTRQVHTVRALIKHVPESTDKLVFFCEMLEVSLELLDLLKQVPDADDLVLHINTTINMIHDMIVKADCTDKELVQKAPRRRPRRSKRDSILIYNRPR